MRKALTISIPEPCHENWNAMTSNEKGRHCAVCEKTVYDFTSKNDGQIISAFETDGKLCGRFKNTQLQRELVISRKERNNYLSLVASGLFAFLSIGTQDLIAQGNPKTVIVDTLTIPTVKSKPAKSILPIQKIKGLVVDEYNIPLAGTNISVKGTTNGTQTDFDGLFEINVKKGSTLILSYVGYNNKEIIINNSKNLNLIMTENTVGLLGIVVVGTPSYSYRNYAFSVKQQARKERRTKIRNGEIKRTRTGKLLYNITNIFRVKN